MLYQGNFCSKLTKKIVLENNILFDLQIGHQKVTKSDFQSQFSTSKIQIQKKIDNISISPFFKCL
jgi:hypothetical protein